MAEFFHCYVSSLGRNHFPTLGLSRIGLPWKESPCWNDERISTQHLHGVIYHSPLWLQWKSWKSTAEGNGDFSGQLVVNPSQMALLKGLLKFRSELAWMHGDWWRANSHRIIPFYFRKSSTWHQNLVPALVPEYTINEILPGSFSQKKQYDLHSPKVFAWWLAAKSH